MHHKKSFSKSAAKKNGPVTWEALNDDLVEGGIAEISPQKGFLRNSKRNNFIETRTSYNTNNNDQITSENQKSPTFRSVGPNLDSTVNLQGLKYANIIRSTQIQKVSPGYYGRSRLTRI